MGWKPLSRQLHSWGKWEGNDLTRLERGGAESALKQHPGACPIMY